MSTILRQGIRHPLVQRVKAFLRGKNRFVGRIDTLFDAELAEAVKQYQTERRLIADGIVGNQTLASLMRDGMAVLDVTHDSSFPPKPSNLTPLVSNNMRMQLLGQYRYKHTPEKGNPEAITILGDWEDKNIVRFQIPQLTRLGGSGNVRMHTKARDRMCALWAAWEKEGVLDRVMTYDGGFNARFIRGSTSVLSNHAFGTAFDINYEWNQLGATPAFIGEVGCVRELVLLANKHGFYWGGHYNQRPDGMHFEVALEALQ